jgi:hypothetical protein
VGSCGFGSGVSEPKIGAAPGYQVRRTGETKSDLDRETYQFSTDPAQKKARGPPLNVKDRGTLSPVLDFSTTVNRQVSEHVPEKLIDFFAKRFRLIGIGSR